MKLTAKVRLLPTPEQDALLRRTLVTANRACNWMSGQAWETKTFSQFGLQKLVYHDTRARFGLSAQVVVRLVSKVADAYKLDKQRKRKFKETGAIAYDDRILNWRLAAKPPHVTIWLLGGRQTIPFAAGPRQLELLRHQKGESDLALINGSFYLFAVCDIEEPEPVDATDVLGVDLGVTNIAADSDGNVYSSAQVNGLRYRHRKLRQKLQKKGTQSAKRLLKRRSRREARFAADINHATSKKLVANAKDTGRALALEDLGGIRARVTVRKAQRATLHSWSFFQLRSFVEYKARQAGVPVVLVDPRNTSRTCPACGHIDKANRKSQSSFSCVSCGHSGLADTIAATNIRVRGRAAVNLPNAGPVEAASGGLQTHLQATGS